MICQQGRVARVDGGRALVNVPPASNCEACAQGRGCGMSIFNRWFSNRDIQIWIPAHPELRSGDSVDLSVEEDALMRMALWAYGVPLAAFLVAALLAATVLQAQSQGWRDLGVGLAGLCGLVLAMIWVGRRPVRVPMACVGSDDESSS